MLIRTRLVLGYGYLVALLVVTAGTAALALQRFSRGIDRVVADNVRSIEAAMRMLAALEEQNRATFAVLLGKEDARQRLAAAEAELEAGLDAATANITLEEERPILARIREHHEELRAARTRLLAEELRTALLAAWDREVSGPTDAVKADVTALLAANHAAMERADVRTREEAQGGAVALGVLATIALLSLGFLSRGLQGTVLGRLAEIRELAEAAAMGERDRRLRVRRLDELGIVAVQLNAALDRHDQLEASVQGRVAQEKQLVLGVLERLDAPSGLVALDGELIASTLEPDDELALVSLGARVRAERPAPLQPLAPDPRALVPDDPDVAAAAHAAAEEEESPAEEGPVRVVRQLTAEGGKTFHLELLLIAGVRPVGWLVERLRSQLDEEEAAEAEAAAAARAAAAGLAPPSDEPPRA